MIEEIVKWHKKTFPDADLKSQKLKFVEEYREYLESGDIMELADMVIVCYVLRGRFKFEGFDGVIWHELILNGHPEGLRKAVIEKMKINKKRRWKKEGGVYRHE